MKFGHGVTWNYAYSPFNQCFFYLQSDAVVVGGWGEGVRVEEEGDVDMDILNLVAGMCSGYPEPLVPAQTNK